MDKLFRRVRFSVSVSALLTVVIGLALTALLFASLRRVESERRNVEFQQSARLRTAAVAAGLADAVDQVMVLNQLFHTVGLISREQFRDFTAPLLQRTPGIQALSFPRLVMRPARRAYESARQRLTPGFTITEFVDGRKRQAAVRASYNVVDYIEPVAGNEAVLGLDTAVSADQAQARAHSRANGQVAATSLLTLVQHKGWHTGFLVVAPDWEPVIWSEEDRGTGTYWGAKLPDSFIEYATPDVQGEVSKSPEVLKEAIASLS